MIEAQQDANVRGPGTEGVRDGAGPARRTPEPNKRAVQGGGERAFGLGEVQGVRGARLNGLYGRRLSERERVFPLGRVRARQNAVKFSPNACVRQYSMPALSHCMV